MSSVWFVAIVAAATVGHVVSEECGMLVDGAPCNDANGVASRCRTYRCPVAKPCKKDAKEQECDDGFCVMQSNSSELNCIPQQNVVDHLIFDACIDKEEGAACTYYRFNYRSKKAAVINDAKGTCDKKGRCMTPHDASCNGKKNGSACSFELPYGTENELLSGVCQERPGGPTQCYHNATKIIGTAQPVKAFDNRPGARNTGNVSDVDFCDFLGDGKKCTNKDGAESRCANDDCLPTPKSCNAKDKELQLCGNTDQTFCFGFLSDELKCVDRSYIRAKLQMDACNDKKDGDECDYIELETDKAGRLTVYENGKSKCKDRECLSPSLSVCGNASDGDPCTYNSVEEGQVVRYSGSCDRSHAFSHCQMKSLQPSTDVVKAATVIKQGPASDKLKDSAALRTYSFLPATVRIVAAALAVKFLGW